MQKKVTSKTKRGGKLFKLLSKNKKPFSGEKSSFLVIITISI